MGFEKKFPLMDIAADLNADTKKKLEKMMQFLEGFKRVIVAFSGGVDSSTLAAVCKSAGIDILAVTVVSQKSPSRELEDAPRIAKEIGVRHEFVNMDIMTPEFKENTTERCYFCKSKLLSSLISLADEKGYDAVFEGTNASDLLQHRPGYRAVREMQRVYSPWAEFGITKEEIRMISRSMGFSFYEKPSLACLASRIPFGVRIDEQKLRMVDEAENFVINTVAVKQVRVRNYDGVAVVEVGEDEVEKLLEKALEVRDGLKRIGFRAVLIDLDGYRMGKRLF